MGGKFISAEGENSLNISHECFNFPLGLFLWRMCVWVRAFGHKELIRGPNSRGGHPRRHTLLVSAAKDASKVHPHPRECIGTQSFARRSDFNLA